MLAAHQPVLDVELFDQAQQARAANRRVPGPKSVPSGKRTHSLSGLGTCARCGSRLHVMTDRHSKARIYCYAARQGHRCGQRSVHLDLIEDQVAKLLAAVHLPDETVAEVIRLYERANDQRDDVERRRREISGRIERIAEMYKWGDLTRDAYRAERERLEAELAALRVATSQAEVLVQAAAFLKDLLAAWEAASPEQCNALARLVFESIEIEDDRVLAVVPQPDFAPFFVKRAMDEGLLEKNDNGATEVTPSSQVLNGRKRRGSHPHVQNQKDGPRRVPVLDFRSSRPHVPRWPSRREVSGPRWYRSRARKLTLEQEATIRALAGTKSLRSLAADFGVSHETVRSINSDRWPQPI